MREFPYHHQTTMSVHDYIGCQGTSLHVHGTNVLLRYVRPRSSPIRLVHELSRSRYGVLTTAVSQLVHSVRTTTKSVAIQIWNRYFTRG